MPCNKNKGLYTSGINIIGKGTDGESHQLVS